VDTAYGGVAAYVLVAGKKKREMKGPRYQCPFQPYAPKDLTFFH
jgi:hypothetical protein